MLILHNKLVSMNDSGTLEHELKLANKWRIETDQW